MSEVKSNVYIAAGSNIEPEKNIVSALEILKQCVQVISVSTFYQTKSIGCPEQPYFLNGIFLVYTDIQARGLKYKILRQIESKLKRVRTNDKYAPRTIDLDIIIYEDKVINELDLQIPDPDIRKRPFLAIPLLELAPSLILPDTGEPLASLEIIKSDSGMMPVCSFTEHLRIFHL